MMSVVGPEVPEMAALANCVTGVTNGLTVAMRRRASALTAREASIVPRVLMLVLSLSLFLSLCVCVFRCY